VPGRRYRLEAPGAIIDPEADLLPGAGQAVNAVRHFVDVHNDDFGVTLSQVDSGLVEFGHRTTAEDPLRPDPANSTVLAMALDNMMDWNEADRNQAGETHFRFRYSLRGHGPGFDACAAVRFGWEDNNELEPTLLPAGQGGALPADAHSFLRVGPGSVILTALKVAEEEGLVARLRECAGAGERASLAVAGLGAVKEARRTDLLERDRESLMVQDGEIEVPVRRRGLATVRLVMGE
jgi:alpha-mannosidase